MISSIVRSSLKFQFLVLTIAVVLVAFGVTQFRPELLIRGSRERLSATLMTAMATGFAFLPFVLFGNIPGLDPLHRKYSDDNDQ